MKKTKQNLIDELEDMKLTLKAMSQIADHNHKVAQDARAKLQAGIDYINSNNETLYTSSLEYDYEENSYLDYNPSDFPETLRAILEGKEVEQCK